MTVLATDLAPGRGALEVAKATAAAINGASIPKEEGPSVFSTTGTTATQALDISGFVDADATALANFVAGVVEALQAKGVL